MTLTHKSVKTLLEEFRSAAPTPGGGSASALAGAVGASLLAMVAGLPKPRASGDEDLQTLREAGQRSAALAIELEGLVDRDSEAYELVVSAYRLPKGTDEEKAVRARRIQEALVVAIAAPLDVMRACRAAIALGPVLRAARQSQRIERSSGGVGAPRRRAAWRTTERRDQPRQREGSGLRLRGLG